MHTTNHLRSSASCLLHVKEKRTDMTRLLIDSDKIVELKNTQHQWCGYNSVFIYLYFTKNMVVSDRLEETNKQTTKRIHRQINK